MCWVVDNKYRLRTTNKTDRIIFLDRDGVINKKPTKASYVTHWRDFVLLPGAIDGLRYLTQKGYLIFIITNQAGIARGLVAEDTLEEIHHQFLALCQQEHIRVTKIYYCPHGWNDHCSCRKPKPGMLVQAAKEYHFDITNAVFVGDDIRDKEAGDAAGCQTIMMKSNGSLFETVLQYEKSLI